MKFMEFLPSTLSINHQFSPAIPFLKWRCRRNPSRLSIPHLQNRNLHSRRPFPLFSFPPISSKKSYTSACFRRPTKRQNYLRKKLTHQRQQFQQVSHDQNQPTDFNKVDMYDSNSRNSVESRNNLNEVSLDDNLSDFDGIRTSETESSKKRFGQSVLWSKFENWVEQFKKDSEFWGVGTGHIFTIYQNAEGKVERVVVNEDEILKRSHVNPRLDNEIEELDEVNFKISYAKDLAMEMEDGNNVIPKNSSVARFLLSGGKSKFLQAIKGVSLKPALFSKTSRVGVLVLCGAYVVWAIRRRLSSGNEDKKKYAEENQQYTRLEKEMLRRKIKARVEKERMAKGSVEVVQDPIEPVSLSFTRPQLDKEALMNSIIDAKKSKSELEMVNDSTYQSEEFKEKIEGIRAMARHVREIERGQTSPDEGEAVNDQALENLSSHGASHELPTQSDLYDIGVDGTKKSTMSSTNTKYDKGKSSDGASGKKGEAPYNGIFDVVIPNGAETTRPEASNMKQVLKSSGLDDAGLHFDGPVCQSGSIEDPSRKKLKIITSAKEAREYLLRKNHKEANQEHNVGEEIDNAITISSTNVTPGNTSDRLDLAEASYDTSPLSQHHDFPHISEDHSPITEANLFSVDNLEISSITAGCQVGVYNNGSGMAELETPGEKEEDDIETSLNSDCINEISSFAGMEVSTLNKVYCKDEVSTLLKDQSSEYTGTNSAAPQVPGTASFNDEKDTTAELSRFVNKGNWIEKNFHEFEPIVKKIGVGFRENYQIAREKASQECDSKTDIMQLKSDCAEDELEWMKDEKLREIVLKVRDNELSGRDPFHLMGEEDKVIFFRGLEQKVEKVNESLLHMHEYFHSNIENLNYGADGISIYDPLEKIIPRWKSPPVEKNPEFLENFLEQRKVLTSESLKNSPLSNETGKLVRHNSEEPSSQNNVPMVGNVSDTRGKLQKDSLTSSKTIIQGSDGSIRKGKRSGKEFWQHTKKWSQGFLESYNAESDPEVKAVMKDIGKDLDRWITEKEIQEAAELMNNLPEKGQTFIKQKLDKIKREMELFGPQAVVSKYREYAEEKEEDYLWWLDLSYVLCIELYTIENGEQRVGLYSLEMAADLALDPKQYHVIAFEDASDCKNLCYIIQAHMELLGDGQAFVVARPPKDAFREAKANGFSVTVIRKGQLQLNIDQTLEEVEESITEIGSKIYHDKIMKERGVDINTMMKGVFGMSKPTESRGRKRSKRKLK